MLGQVSDLSFIQSARSQRSPMLTVSREMPHNKNKNNNHNPRY